MSTTPTEIMETIAATVGGKRNTENIIFTCESLFNHLSENLTQFVTQCHHTLTHIVSSLSGLMCFPSYRGVPLW